jgi:hypothetical protein
VAVTVTGLSGMGKVQGLTVGPAEHEAPVTVHVNCQVESVGVA